MVSCDQQRISGQLFDRFDIHIEVPRVEYDKLTDDRLGEPSAAVRDRVEAARGRQRERFDGAGLTSNADMGPAEVRQFCAVDEASPAGLVSMSLLRAPKQQLHMSARAYHPILKTALAIADLGGSDHITTPCLAEAIQYRPRQSI